MNAERADFFRFRPRGSGDLICEAASGRARSRKVTVQIFVLLFILQSAFCNLNSHADEPATQPATRPTEFPRNSPFRRWFTRLADPDPRVREQAQTELMGMTADDLPAFRQLIKTSKPLAPGQIAPLRDIVNQVFLSGEMYRDDSGEYTDSNGTSAPYFLGVYWPMPPEFDANEPRLGVPIIHRICGFPSFRFLRDGDMILGVSPDLATPMSDTHTVEILKMTLKPVPQPQNVILLVLRDGQQIRIPVRLSPHPQECVPLNDAIEAFAAARAHRADDYWNENFRPVVEQELVVDAE
jgi:hypothetical protein